MSVRSKDEVRLREVEDADLDVLFEHQADKGAAELVAFASRDPDAFLAHWAKIRADETVYLYAVDVDGSLAGHVVSWLVPGRRIIGYWFGREYWGRGIATRALSLFLDTVPERPLHAVVALHNVGSIRVLEKCGFSPVDGRASGAAPAEGDDVAEVLMVLEG